MSVSASTCALCKHGHDSGPGGRKVPPGTIWCHLRKLQMGRSRSMSCFVPRAGRRIVHCLDCRWAKPAPAGGIVPQPGNVWCAKRRFEINKQRAMECFE